MESEVCVMEQDCMRKCPVCGTEIPYTVYYEEPAGLVELHTYCPVCGYFAEKCYSPTYEGICEGYDPKYENRIKELGLRIVREEEMP